MFYIKIINLYKKLVIKISIFIFFKIKKYNNFFNEK